MASNTKAGRTAKENVQMASQLAGPPVNPAFAQALDDLVAIARQGHRPDSPLFNPSDEWLVRHMPIFQDMSEPKRRAILEEADRLAKEAAEANAQGKAASRVWPEAVIRLNSGGLAFYSQLGVARRPDLTQYFIDGFPKNRDALAFSAENQALFAEVFPYITRYTKEKLAAGDTIIQTDRQIADAPGRSFHARQLLYGVRYLQLPYFWRQLTFDLSPAERAKAPDILEVTLPTWLEDLGLPDALKRRIADAGLTQLIFKAPTKGLSLHLGFDYVGEHKMGPLSVAMFKAKQNKGLAIQAALSAARVKTLEGHLTNAALVTVGPSLHGKSTLTIMIELANSELGRRLRVQPDYQEGVYPMNDDIVLLQPLDHPMQIMRGGRPVTITHAIDGTENNFYAMPAGLTRESDPITYDVVRGTEEDANPQETLENVPVDPAAGIPDFEHNPVRNMRLVLSRQGLLARKGVHHVIGQITKDRVKDSVHIPMEDMDRILWQAVMRQNTVVPPLRRLTAEQYIRVLMYGEAVQMGAASGGTIGRPYVEYFSDPFIIGLEDDNANIMYGILKDMERGGLPQEYYVFNTGGIGADTNEQASGARYRKIPRELTLMLQEALLRGAVRFEYDTALGSDVAVAIIDDKGREVVDLRHEWLPHNIYGVAEYNWRIVELAHGRYYGGEGPGKAGILRYTKAQNEIFDLSDIPAPVTERELSWLLSFYWHLDQAYDTLAETSRSRGQGQRPSDAVLARLRQVLAFSQAQGLKLSDANKQSLASLGLPEV